MYLKLVLLINIWKNMFLHTIKSINNNKEKPIFGVISFKNNNNKKSVQKQGRSKTFDHERRFYWNVYELH